MPVRLISIPLSHSSIRLFAFSRFDRWFTATKFRALPLDNYSIAGLEVEFVVKRKDLPGVHSLTPERCASWGSCGAWLRLRIAC